MRRTVRSREPVERSTFEPATPSSLLGPSIPGVRPHPHLTLEAAAAYATHIDAARVRAASEGRTLIYTIRWI